MAIDLMMRPDGTRWNTKRNPNGKQWWWQWNSSDENKNELDNILKLYIDEETKKYETLLRHYDDSIQTIQNNWNQAIQEGRYRKIPALEKRHNFLQKQKYNLANLLTDDYIHRCGFISMISECVRYVEYRETAVGW